MRVQPEEATEHAPDDVWEETQDGGHAQEEGHPLVVGELGRAGYVTPVLCRQKVFITFGSGDSSVVRRRRTRD